MSVLRRKLLRDMLAARTTLVAVIIIMTLGSMCFLAFASAYMNLTQAKSAYYAQCRMADFSVAVKKLPKSELSRLNQIAGISELQPRISFDVSVQVEDVIKPVSARMLSLPDDPKPGINTIVMQSGSYFTTPTRGEVIVNDKFAQAHQLSPGDTVRVTLNNRQQELLIIGTAISSEFVYLIEPGGLVPDAARYGVFYISESFAEDVFDFDGACNEIVGQLARGANVDVDVVLDEIEERIDDFGVLAKIPLEKQPSNWFLSSEIDGLRIQITVLPSIFLAVAAVILNVQMIRTVEQQRVIVGTLKALGYSNRAVLWHYLEFGMFVGLIAGLLGVGFGYLGAMGITEIYKEFFAFPQLQNRFSPPLAAATIAVSMAFSTFGTWRGCQGISKLKPAEAMRPASPKPGKRTILEKWPWMWKRIGFRWQYVFRGLFRNWGRVLSGLFAASMGASLLIVTFFMQDSTMELIQFQFDKLLLSDFEVGFSSQKDYDVFLEAQRLPGVDYAEPILNVGGTFYFGHQEMKGSITGLTSQARLTVPRDVAGNAIDVPASGVLLTRKIAEELHVQEGDILRFVASEGLQTESKIPVGRIVDSYLGLAAYMDFRQLNRMIREEMSVTNVQLLVNPTDTESRRFYTAVKQLPGIRSTSAIRDQKKNFEEVFINQMIVSIIITILFAGMLFLGSIMNSTLISLSERRREIATLRVIGYTNRQVGEIFLRESLIIQVAGTLLGIPLGYLLCSLFVTLYNTELFRLPFVMHVSTFLNTVGLGILFTFLAHFPVQRAIQKMHWLDALNVRE